MTTSQRTAAKVPKDHLPKGGEPEAPVEVEFEFDGETYTVPAAEEWSIDIIEASEEQRFVAALRMLLGDVQWARFRTRHNKARDLGEMFEAAGEAVGVPN